MDSEKTCKDLYAKLQTGHKEREEAIRGCIMVSAESLKTLRQQREIQPDDIDVDKKFKSEQRKVNQDISVISSTVFIRSFLLQLRVLQSELSVEDIVKERSYKAFNERCRVFFRAGSATL